MFTWKLSGTWLEVFGFHLHTGHNFIPHCIQSQAGENDLQPYLIPAVSQGSSFQFPTGAEVSRTEGASPGVSPAPPFGCPFPETATGLGRTRYEAGCVAEQDAQ